ncbi:hypothetical protein MMC21_000376 [Puttea exsequens]|nr:hypothetical protein [Puttea exsequens]
MPTGYSLHSLALQAFESNLYIRRPFPIFGELLDMAQQLTAKRQQELQQQYTNYKNSLQQLAQRIGDIEQDAEEHKLVLETLGPLPPDRKCFRMINGVLVERTVNDVTPALQTNAEGLKKVLEELVKQYKRQQDEMEKWKKKNNIQVVQQ